MRDLHTPIFSIKRSTHPHQKGNYFAVTGGSEYKHGEQYLQHDGTLQATCHGGWFKNLDELGTAMKLHAEHTAKEEEEANRVRRVKSRACDALRACGLELIEGIVRDQFGNDTRIG